MRIAAAICISASAAEAITFRTDVGVRLQPEIGTLMMAPLPFDWRLPDRDFECAVRQRFHHDAFRIALPDAGPLVRGDLLERRRSWTGGRFTATHPVKEKIARSVKTWRAIVK